MDTMLGLIQQLMEEKQNKGSISGDKNTAASDDRQRTAIMDASAEVLAAPSVHINQHDVLSGFQG
jgi:hypothetical protein